MTSVSKPGEVNMCMTYSGACSGGPAKFPEDPSLGDIIFCTDTKTFFVYAANEWIKLSSKDVDLKKKKQSNNLHPKIYQCSCCGATIHPHQSKCDYCNSDITWTENEVTDEYLDENEIQSILKSFRGA